MKNMVLKRTVGVSLAVWSSQHGSLVAFASDPSGELDVLGHDRHSLGVDRAQIGVLE